jgi:hypothetical protein
MLCALGRVHTAQDAKNVARQVVQVMPARLKVRMELADSWKIALVMVRQLIVFHRQITNVWRTGENGHAAQNDFSLG